MKTTLIAFSLVALMSGAAQAQTYPSGSVVANSVVNDTGSERAPTYGPGLTHVVQGRLVPANGNEAIVETLNSLPNYSTTRAANIAAAYASSRPNYVVQGNLLPANGAEGIVQSANSLPSGY